MLELVAQNGWDNAKRGVFKHFKNPSSQFFSIRVPILKEKSLSNRMGIHTAKIVKEWLAKQNFKDMECPAQSSDLNTIENLWSIVKRRLGQYQAAPCNLDDLWRRVEIAWNQILKQIIQNLVESMSKRRGRVIIA